jgi:ATP-binding cassette subfamily B protein
MTDETLGELSDQKYPLLALVRRHGRSGAHYLSIAVACEVVSTFLSFADVFLIGLGIDALFNGERFAVPLLPQAWIPTEPLDLLVFVTGLLVGLNLLTNLLAFVSEYGFAVFTQRFLHEVRVGEFDAVQRLDMGFFDGSRTGNVISVLNDDVNTLDTFFNVIVGAALWITVTLVSALVYMTALNWQLALAVLLSAPVIAGLNLWFSGKLEPLKDAVREERGALNARLETNISGIDVVKSFTAEAYERERVADSSLDVFESRLASRRTSVRQSPLNRLVVGAWLLLTLAVGIYWITVEPPLLFAGTLTAGQLVPFLFYLERLTLPLKHLSGVIDHYKSSKAAAKRIHGLTSAGKSLGASDGTDGDADADAAPNLELDGGRVEFERVEFGYPDSDRRVFDGLEFAVEPGETIGLVGSTGAGKSTLVKLLLRFYDVDSGAVRVDGQDVREVSTESLRDAIGYVNQEAFLFDGTVRENIAYGAPEATDERVEAAARSAGAHRFVTELPEGYDTRVGERGTSLSGGQRQRIAIARAVVGDPPMLVLDEATSHVDNETELVLQENLDDLTADRTTFVVAHRLSTVRDADQILVLDDGEIVERGTHEDLLERDGRYANLWRIQVGEVEGVRV